MDELRAELKEVIDQIEVLKHRKASIERELIKGSNEFKDKFMIWFKSDSGKDNPWLIRAEEYPLLRRKFDLNIDAYRRGETVYLENLLMDEVFEIWTQDDVSMYCDTQEEINDFYEELDIFLKENQPLLEEAMNKNIKSFKVDW